MAVDNLHLMCVPCASHFGAVPYCWILQPDRTMQLDLKASQKLTPYWANHTILQSKYHDSSLLTALQTQTHLLILFHAGNLLQMKLYCFMPAICCKWNYSGCTLLLQRNKAVLYLHSIRIFNLLLMEQAVVRLMINSKQKLSTANNFHMHLSFSKEIPNSDRRGIHFFLNRSRL